MSCLPQDQGKLGFGLVRMDTLEIDPCPGWPRLCFHAVYLRPLFVKLVLWWGMHQLVKCKTHTSKADNPIKSQKKKELSERERPHFPKRQLVSAIHEWVHCVPCRASVFLPFISRFTKACYQQDHASVWIWHSFSPRKGTWERSIFHGFFHPW